MCLILWGWMTLRFLILTHTHSHKKDHPIQGEDVTSNITLESKSTL